MRKYILAVFIFVFFILNSFFYNLLKINVFIHHFIIFINYI